jgi:hypothetical protein
MKQLTLNIPDSKFDAFLDLIKTLEYVSVEEQPITQAQQDEVNKRLNLIERGEMKTRNWQDAHDAIFRK